MRHPSLLVVSLALALQAGCSCIVDPGSEEEGQPCLDGLCLSGYRCENKVCVSSAPKRDAGTVVGKPDGGALPAQADAGSGWEAAESIGHPWSGSPLPDFAPRLAISDNGDVFLAFADSDGAINLRRRRASSGAWDPIHAICDAGCSGPQIAAGPGGRAVVAWSTGTTVEASFFDPAGGGWPGGWQSPRYAATGLDVPVTLVGIDLRSFGAAALYKVGQPGGPFDLSLTASADGTWHQTGVATGLPADSAGAMAIAVDDPNLLILTVYSNHAQVVSARTTFTTRAPDLQPGPTDTLFSPPMLGAQVRSIVLASEGSASTLAAFDSIGPGAALRAARFSNPAWGATSEIAGPGEQPAAAVDTRGDGLVLFRQCLTDCAIWGTGYDHFGGFIAPAQVGAEGPSVDQPRVALDGAGRALQVWLQDGTVWASETLELRNPFPFGAPRQISPATGAFVPSSPALVYFNGLGYAAWLHQDGSFQTLEGVLYRAPAR